MINLNNVLKFTCTYQQNGEIKDDYNWSGYIERSSCKITGGSICSIEGVIIDQQLRELLITEISPYRRYKQGYNNKRYLCVEYGMCHSEGTVKFVIFPLDHQPIDYELLYDAEDNCLYGVWYFVNKDLKNSEYGGFAKLNIDQEFDIDVYTVQSEIQNCGAYYQNSDTIGNLIQHRKPNIQQHDEADAQRFIDAKNYFRKFAKTRKMNNGEAKINSF